VPGQPKMMSPDPPSYRSCIAYFRRFPPKYPAGEPRPQATGLKAKCEFEYQKEKLKALYVVISSAWIAGEAGELGVRVSQDEVHMQVTAARRSPAFQGYLESNGLTLHDLEERIRLSLLTAKIRAAAEAKLAAGAHGGSARIATALVAFGREFETRWKRRTICGEKFNVPLCSNYRHPRRPLPFTPPAVPLVSTAEGGTATPIP